MAKSGKIVIIILVLLLCLIPFFGFLAGIVALIFAIFKLKSKYGILLSCTGILLCFLSTFLFIRYLLTSEATRPHFAELSLIQLNRLIPNIEFYKLQNHIYPDSLEQLNNDSLAGPLIQDPILIWNYKNKNSSTTFIYKKIGDKYTVYSVGEDLVPNTRDDIYPNLKLDSSYSGFTKHQ